MAASRNKSVLSLFPLFLLLLPQPAEPQSSSAVITLVMPVGARQLGMGETAVAVADDVFATFWNPAGLAFGPLSDEWKLSLSKEQGQSDYTALGSREKQGFLQKPTVWSAGKEGLLHYDGKVWKSWYERSLEQDDKVDQVVKEYLGTEAGLDSALVLVKALNNIRSKEDEDDLVSLRLPYNLLLGSRPVNELLLDKSERLWVGTPTGLFRFDGGQWKNFTGEDVTGGAEGVKFGSRAITCLAMKGSEIWVGTDSGLFYHKKNEFVQRGENILPSQRITAIAVNENSPEIYIAMNNKGVARYTPPRSKGLSASWKLFGTQDGLLDSVVLGMVLDRYGHLWVAHPGGVSHYTMIEWQRNLFPNQNVKSIDLDQDGNLWIGTDKGVWKHSPKHLSAKKSQAGEVAATGDWVHYHTGNALSNNRDLVVKTQGDNVWFVTEAGVESYASAKSQVGLFYESLLPQLQLSDLFHVFTGATFPVSEWGTVGGFVNFISFGQISQTNEAGEETQTFASSELVAALSYGTRLTKNTGMGLNAKLIYSALAPGTATSGEKADGIAVSYALDAGFLWKRVWLRGLSLGLVLQNIGPAIFYVDKDQSDPIPFTWKLGAAYEVFSTPNHRLLLAGDLNREAVFIDSTKGGQPVWIGAWKDLAYPFGDGDRNHTNLEVWQENVRKTVWNAGAEYTYANVVSFRGGYLFDNAGQREEIDFGLGFMLSDILQIDATFIKALNGGIRDGQKRFSMIFKF